MHFVHSQSTSLFNKIDFYITSVIRAAALAGGGGGEGMDRPNREIEKSVRTKCNPVLVKTVNRFFLGPVYWQHYTGTRAALYMKMLSKPWASPM